jgi:hypothetical protein
MRKQNYANHVRYYAPHHFIFYPLLLIFIGIAVFLFLNDTGNRWVWAAFFVLLLLIGFLSLLLRQHYALMNQNRIVRLELRFRYYVLTQKRFEEIENKLSSGQIHALRFASDEEFVALTERSVRENLSPDQIKRAIKNWLPDNMRV